jgi:hypothetical protein
MFENFKQKYFDKWRWVQLMLLVFGIAIFVGADWYWSNICAVEICDVYFIDAFLAPLQQAGLVLAAAVAPFLLVPTHYFRTWLLWVFPAITALAIFRLSTIDPNSSNMFAASREAFVSGLLLDWLIISGVFIAYHYYRTKRRGGEAT